MFRASKALCLFGSLDGRNGFKPATMKIWWFKIYLSSYIGLVIYTINTISKLSNVFSYHLSLTGPHLIIIVLFCI